MATPRVNGGIISDQMLAGTLKYFKMVGTFAYAVSDGTVTVGPGTSGGSTPTTYYNLVGTDQPVPESLAEHALSVIQERCTVVEIGFVGAPGAETALHFAAENTAFGWIDAAGDVDTAAMVAAIAAAGATITVPTTHAGAVDDNTVAPATATPSTTVVITEVPFILA